MSSFLKHNKGNAIEEYINQLYLKHKITNVITKKQGKITDDNVIIPTSETIDLLINNNYNIQQLKFFAKHYKLKLSGNKQHLVGRLYVFLNLSSHIYKIQKIWRGFLQRKYNKAHGPAFQKRKLCTNETDFLSGEEVSKIPYTQFFSFKDADNFIYGFDIISLYNLIVKSGKDVKNPYNRNQIHPLVLNDIKTLIRLSRLLKINIEIDIKEEIDVSKEKTIELRTLGLFQNIDALGNYSCPEWFLSLNRIQIIRFLRELIDIWNYRAQITDETKQNVCPPYGHPFRNNALHCVSHESNMDNVRKYILEIMEKFVNSGVDKDSKSLGAYYVLGALTIVNENAASSLPWLFQTFAYF